MPKKISKSVVLACLFLVFGCTTSRAQDLLLFEYKELFGYVDKELNVVIEPRFVKASSFNSDGYAVVSYGKRDFAIITTSGKEVYRVNTPSMRDISDGLFAYYGDRGRTIYDLNSKKIIAEGLRGVGSASEGRIVVRFMISGPDAGYINYAGEKLLEGFSFRKTNVFREQVASVILDDWYSALITIDGNIVGESKYLRLGDHFSEGLIFVQTEDGRTGYMKPDGTIAFYLPIVISEGGTATDFSNGYALIQVKSEPSIWRVINSQGDYISKELFVDEARGFVEGYSVVARMNRATAKASFGYIDTFGKYLVEPSFDQAEAFYKGYARIKLDGRAGLLDMNGKIIWSDEIYKGK